MSNLMNLPTELHHQILREIIHEPLDNDWEPSDDIHRAYTVNSIKTLRSIVASWTTFVDQLFEDELRYRRGLLQEMRKNGEWKVSENERVVWLKYRRTERQYNTLAKLIADVRS